MLYLSYDKPIERSNLPALNAAFDRLKARIRRRRILSGVCDTLCFLLYTGLMLLGAVGTFRRFAGAEYAAVLDGLPHVKEVFTAVFQKLPALFGQELKLPELLCVPAAVLLPPLLCLPVALVLRLLLRLKKRPAAERSAETLLGEARELSERSRKSRKANWTMISSFLILAAFAAAVVYSLLVVNPASEDWDIKYILSYTFIGIIAFFCFQVMATLTDMLLELLCGLDAQWDGTKLIEGLEAFIEKEAANAVPDETAPPAAETAPPAQEAAPAQEIGPGEGDAP